MNYPGLIQEIQVQLSLPELSDPSLEEFRDQLSHYINTLIQKDFNRLVNILYRVDVDEDNLKTLLAGYPGQDAGTLIADAIIERQMIKMQHRNDPAGDQESADEERW